MAKKTKKISQTAHKTCCGGSGCKVKGMIKNAPKEVKLSYLLILILFVLMLLFQLFGGTSNKTIGKWIEQNPEAILNSVNKFVSEKQKEIMEQKQKVASEGIKTKKEEIQSTKYSGVVNPKGSVTVVEFFDYNCGYCKHVSKIVDKIAMEDKNVRFIFKELPILGEPSRQAAKVAIAVSMIAPNKYLAVHNALMEDGAKTEEDLKNAVKKAGLKYSDVEKILKSKGDKIEKALNTNLELASAIGINGTPAFVVGDEFVPGALDYNSLKGLIEKAKK